MADRIQLRRDTAANWTAYNPILLEGEPGIEIDTDQWKLGDGIHNWNALPYRGGECVQQRGQSTTVAMSQKAVTDELNEIYIKNTVEFSTTYQYKALNVSLKAGSIVTVLPNGNSSNYYFFYGADNTNNYITLTPGKTVILDHEIIAIKSSNSTTAITYVNTIFLTQDSVNDKLSLTSVFPVQNKVVKAAIDGINTEIGGINTKIAEIDGINEEFTIGTINTNIYAFNKILDINIKTGDTFKFRITGQGDIARFMLLCNGSYTTPSNLIKDYCQFDTWYEFTAIKDITSLGYQTGDNPNATDVVLELLLGTSLQGRISKLEEEQPEDNANCAMMTSKLYLTDKRTDLFFSPLFANWQFLNNRLCRVSAEGASIYRHFRNFVTIDATQNGTLYFRTYNEKYDIIDSKAVNTIVTPQSKSGSIRCLFIGSSITGHGIYQNRLKTMCGEGFESIGTRHAGQDDDCYFEAVGGWGFAAFASYKTVKTNATSPFWHPANGRYWGVVGFWKDVMTYNEFDSSNPNSYVMNGRKTTATAAGFGQDGYISGSRLQVGDIMYDDANSHFVQWNGSSWVQIDTPTNWGFDFVKYGNMWNITAPDLFVMAELSTNDFRGASSTPNFTTWNNNAEAMFTALKAWKNDIKIAMLIPISTFGLTCVQGSEFFERSNYRMYQSRLNQIEHFDNREDEGIYLIDDAIFFDEEYGYGISTNADMTKPNQEYAGNEKLRVQTSSPHPNAQGEYLLADGMYGIIQYVRKTN